MTETWSHRNPVRILYGRGRLSCLGSLAGDRVLLVTTAGARRRGMIDLVERSCGGRDLTVFEGVRPNPTMADLIEAIRVFRGQQEFDTIVGLGGGSSLDFAKVLAVGLGAGEDWELKDHLAGGGAFPRRPPVPLIAIPTTAGTGSEVTPFATVWDLESGVKRSLSDASMFPAVAIVDPQLLAGTPRDVAVSCGLDALAQALDSWWNRNATVLTRAWSLAAVSLAWRALPGFAEDRDDPELSGKMLTASLMSGLAISQTRTAMSHAMSYPVTLKFGIPHGVACGFTLPALWDHVAATCPGSLEEIVTALGWQNVKDGGRELRGLLGRLGVPRILAETGMTADAALALVPSMFPEDRAGNQWPVCSVEEVRAILRASL